MLHLGSCFGVVLFVLDCVLDLLFYFVRFYFSWVFMVGFCLWIYLWCLNLWVGVVYWFLS